MYAMGILSGVGSTLVAYGLFGEPWYHTMIGSILWTTGELGRHVLRLRAIRNAGAPREISRVRVI